MFEKTPLKDALIYRPPFFKDDRGWFTESYNKKHFEAQGINEAFVQDNRSFSKKGTLRGLHYQSGSSAQAKLVGVIKGEVFDVAVDLRESSPTFKQWYGVNLKGGDGTYFYVPRGFAHGFVVLSDEAEFYYKCDNFYNKESERGVLFNDPELNIDWKLEGDFILSEKDRELPHLKDAEYFS